MIPYCVSFDCAATIACPAISSPSLIVFLKQEATCEEDAIQMAFERLSKSFDMQQDNASGDTVLWTFTPASCTVLKPHDEQNIFGLPIIVQLPSHDLSWFFVDIYVEITSSGGHVSTMPPTRLAVRSWTTQSAVEDVFHWVSTNGHVSLSEIENKEYRINEHMKCCIAFVYSVSQAAAESFMNATRSQKGCSVVDRHAL